jgi:lipoyl(octanoyl) transferase
MPDTDRDPCESPPVPLRKPLAVWLGGTIGWDDYLAMSDRLAGEVADPRGRNPTLVVCEFEPSITVGRLGSRSDIRLSDDDLRARRLAVRFTGRGGGAVLHGPGQVVVAMVAPLDDLGLGQHDVGGYLARFEQGIAHAIRAVRCGSGLRQPGVHGLFGRTGLMAAVGVAVRRGVACHGAFVNVCPALDGHQRIDTVPAALREAPGRAAAPFTMGSIEADVQRRVRLQDVRTAVVQGLADAFAFPRIHINAGFPYPVRPVAPSQPEVVSRVG